MELSVHHPKVSLCNALTPHRFQESLHNCARCDLHSEQVSDYKLYFIVVLDWSDIRMTPISTSCNYSMEVKIALKPFGLSGVYALFIFNFR